MIEQLIKVLRNLGLDLTAREIAEMMWLALHLDGPIEVQVEAGKPFRPEKEAPKREPAPPIGEVTPSPPMKTAPEQQSGPAPTPPAGRGEVHLPSPAKGDLTNIDISALSFRSPSAAALSGTLELSRALRPLNRRVPSRFQFVLDEEATVNRIADEGNWMPVLHPAPSRWLDVVLLVDGWPSMVIWRQTITELQSLLERQGAFRNVQTWGFDLGAPEHPAQQVRLYEGMRWEDRISRLRPPDELIDPRGQRLLLVVSDCISPAWYDARMAQLLATWGKRNLVALAQVLPPRLWQRSGLGQATYVQLHPAVTGAPNATLAAETPIDLFEERLPVGVPIPVMTLEPDPAAAWAQFVGGLGTVPIPGVILPLKPVKYSIQGTGEESAGSYTALERVLEFQAAASPLAWQLAGYFAAAPLSLPVMRLIQGVMLPQSRQVHLAEVFLSGLLKHETAFGSASHPDDIRYDFLEGVRDILISTVPINESVDVLARTSNFVDARIGAPIDFRALIVDPTIVDRVSIEQGNQPFAMVALTTLRRLGGDYARLAERLERHLQDRAMIAESMAAPEKRAHESREHAETISASKERRQKLREYVETELPAAGNGKDDREVVGYVAHQLRQQNCTPIIGNQLILDLLFSKNDLAQAWADEVKYPLGDHRSLNWVSQFLAVAESIYEAKWAYLEFLKKTLLGLARLRSDIDHRFLDEIAIQSSQITVTELALELLGYPHVQQGEPLSILAALDISVYVTTSHHSFLQAALKSAGKAPHTVVYPWHPDLAIPDEYGVDQAFRPTVESPVVYHLFGIDSVDASLVLTEDDHLDFLLGIMPNFLDQHIMPSYIRDALLRNSLLLLGYGVRDLDLRILSRGLLRHIRPHTRFSVATQPDQFYAVGDINQQREYVDSYFTLYSCHVYWGDVQHFLNAVWEYSSH